MMKEKNNNPDTAPIALLICRVRCNKTNNKSQRDFNTQPVFITAQKDLFTL